MNAEDRKLWHGYLAYLANYIIKNSNDYAHDPLSYSMWISYEYELKIGDKIAVTDNGQSFTTYNEFFENNCCDLLSDYAYNETPPNGTVAEIIFVGKHQSYRDYDMYVIKTEVGGKIYLISREGIALISAA